MMSDELLEALEKIFAADSELYQQRGFQRRIGFGKRPALINIDLANAWTRPGNPFSESFSLRVARGRLRRR